MTTRSWSKSESKNSPVAEEHELVVGELETQNAGSSRDASRWESFRDSFKRREVEELDPNLTEAERIAVTTARSPLERSLKTRHLQMIAIGGAIGTGLFVGSGKALATAGPAGILLGWGIMGVMIFAMVMATGELAVTFPVSGGYTTYATRFVDESFGYASNMNYMIAWLVTLPLEIVAASITVDYWGTDRKYRDGFVALFYVVIVLINFFGVKGYGEAEFVFSLIKVVTVIGFIILGIILICGGGPVGGYIGGTYWQNPGAFYGDDSGKKFKGVCTVFVTAAFSFSGSEVIGLAAAETENPRKTLPGAAKQVFWRITLFYIVSMCIIGLLVPYNDDRLLGSSSVDASASPFVLAIKNHGIKGLPSVINVVILIAVLSVGNSAVYICSRTLTALAQQGALPRIFTYIDRKGRPLVSIIFTSVFGLLSFVAQSDKQTDIFNWLMALCGLSTLFNWGNIFLCHIRFRRGLSYQNRTTDELSFKSPVGTIGSWIGFVMIVLIFIAQFYVALFPPGAKPNASNFFQSYLSFFIVLVMYVGHKIYKKNWKLFIRADKIDIDTGRRDVNIEDLKKELAEERAILATKSFWYRSYKFWC
ncbi:LANO_0D11122g1_1 [Lachancea nothofagi CBS 11611]|uniref:LANO_0D11122g1_1 n=1 Tax=Lachancea nothofagi CBS 11611 TaxID=1266666 RepID=A0A1G4JKZ8_9SACH|nr:LANO_0D11122g1_1 [Lachancea nothofagi CBS 11611]